ncbi:conserved Plasmodium protein, unknown function [Plasmodium malariae]|uniref:Uncharacterized protein n=1 Tax=Plasmodium malariae TaxID=5858 RepID=A0A1C3KL35_PLAMA|nr:conserved Plasmodium protein, unknown function [Plasmodium malariae]
MNTTSNEDVNNKDNPKEVKKRKKRKKKIIINVRKKVLRKNEFLSEHIINQNGHKENLPSKEYTNNTTSSKKATSKNGQKSNTEPLKKVLFFDKEYNIREIGRCQISDLLLNRVQKK